MWINLLIKILLFVGQKFCHSIIGLYQSYFVPCEYFKHLKIFTTTAVGSMVVLCHVNLLKSVVRLLGLLRQ